MIIDVKPRVDSPKMPVASSLTHLRLPRPACRSNVGAKAALPLEDGIDDGRAQSGDEDYLARYKRADKVGKARILDELCATTGWHRDHARKALRAALRPQVVRPRGPRPRKYGPKVVAALIFCWATLGMPTGKRLAPMLSELVAILRRFGELDIDEDTAALLAGMSAATIDRRLAGERRKHELKGRSRTKRARC